MSIDTKAAGAKKYAIPIGNTICAFAGGITYGYICQQSGISAYEHPAGGGVAAVPVILLGIESFIILGTNDTHTDLSALAGSFVAMYPALAAGEVIGRGIRILKDSLPYLL